MNRYFFFLFMVSALLVGCSSVRYVPVESIRTDSVYIYRNVTTSVTIKDSLVIDRSADTIKVTQYKYVGERYENTDTVYINRVDTVRIPYAVEKQLGKWEQAKIDIGGMAIGLVCGVILMFGWIVYKVRRG